MAKNALKQKMATRNIWSFVSGFVIGILGGLIGLGGAEFRLPVLVGYFKFNTLQAIIINLVVSLITVFFSFIFRNATIPLSEIGANYSVILNLLAGSLLGALIGVRLAIRINAKKLNNIVFVFLLL